ncbi:MAG: hypothetical protein F7B20_03875 [Aeropyrum sp.]|nr:hypothetical protein [Aeropyrum sp.]MCE4616507.1 hypothetical protein [Aeropyrum sp.]
MVVKTAAGIVVASLLFVAVIYLLPPPIGVIAAPLSVAIIGSIAMSRLATALSALVGYSLAVAVSVPLLNTFRFLYDVLGPVSLAPFIYYPVIAVIAADITKTISQYFKEIRHGNRASTN